MKLSMKRTANCTPIAALSVLMAAVVMPASAETETFTNENGKRVECRDEQVTKDGHPIAAPVAGAVIGGVVGNQIGGGSGKKLATVAGAIGGGVAGKKIDQNRTEDGNTIRRVCREIN